MLKQNPRQVASFIFAAGALVAVALLAQSQQPPAAPAQPLAHFHHLHLNSTDPKAAIDFYTSHFDCEKAKLAGVVDAVWAQKSWILFNKVSQPPPSDIVSALYHFGWGAEDMKATYQQQVDSGTKFSTPITDISETTGRGKPGAFYYAYVEGPDKAMIELNTSSNHNFGHIHMLSADPIGTSEWYIKEFGMTRRGPAPVRTAKPYIFNNIQLSPSASLMMDNVNFIFFPIEFAQTLMPELWKGRTTFESPKGRVMDHFGFSVDNLDETLARLRADGVKVTDEPRSVLGGKVKFAFIEGPDNVRIELVEGHATKM